MKEEKSWNVIEAFFLIIDHLFLVERKKSYQENKFVIDKLPAESMRRSGVHPFCVPRLSEAVAGRDREWEREWEREREREREKCY